MPFCKQKLLPSAVSYSSSSVPAAVIAIELDFVDSCKYNIAAYRLAVNGYTLCRERVDSSWHVLLHGHGLERIVLSLGNAIEGLPEFLRRTFRFG